MPKQKPRNREPVSPIKILAGWKLKNRKPTMLPSRSRQISATMTFPIKKAIVAIVAIAIPDTPAASPSNPSIRLTAFVTPTIQKIVSGMAIQLSSEE
ncbi:hypothetical protein D3C71_1311730 [compost metagenome]